jgi:hypothetical protein
MSVRKRLDKIKEYPLSNFDINDILEPDTKIFTYPQVKDTRNIDELLDSKGRALMLFLTESPTTGHWIGVLRRGDTIELYDPYGKSIHEQEKHLGSGSNEIKQWGQDSEDFTDLVKRSGYRLKWNNRQRQPLSKDTNTCGRHAVLRLLFYKKSLEEYNKLLDTIKKEYGISADDLVSYMTAELLGK